MTWRPLAGTPGITRRRLIASLTAVGTAGALTGVGTAAYLGDRESLPNNLLRAGAFDLEVVGDGTDSDSSTNAFTIDFGDVGSDGTRTETFYVQLPDDPENNPGCPWFRLGCPVVTPEDRAEILAGIEATLVYDPAGVDVEIFSAPLLTLATAAGPNDPVTAYYRALRDGLPLSDVVCGEDDGCDALCLEPGDRMTFELSWTFDTGIARNDDEDVGVVASYLFGAVQQRHSPVPGTSPFGDTETPECEYDLERAYGISYVAFCSRDDDFGDLTPADFEFENLAFDDGPSLVRWTLLDADVDLDAVVIKYGRGHPWDWDKEIFYLGPDRVSGVVAVLAGDQHWADERVSMDLGKESDEFNVNRFPCPGFFEDYRDDGDVDETYYLVKFEWDEEDDEWTSEDGVLVGTDDGVKGGTR